jgi:hypothetical protein
MLPAWYIHHSRSVMDVAVWRFIDRTVWWKRMTDNVFAERIYVIMNKSDARRTLKMAGRSENTQNASNG